MVAENKIPSNRKFGFLMAFIILVTSTYLFFYSKLYLSIILFILSLIFLSLSIFKSNTLTPLNRYWMKFGYFIGLIANPVILGILFFGLFTPIALIMRLFGRDELEIKLDHKKSYWKKIKSLDKIKTNFKNQY